jgi:hypothetical protein
MTKAGPAGKTPDQLATSGATPATKPALALPEAPRLREQLGAFHFGDRVGRFLNSALRGSGSPATLLANEVDDLRSGIGRLAEGDAAGTDER